MENLKGKLEKLAEITSYFEKEDTDIDEGIKKYEEGMKLAQQIKKELTSYELKIKEIKKKFEEE